PMARKAQDKAQTTAPRPADPSDTAGTPSRTKARAKPDTLAEYRARRDFNRTAEPAAKPASRRKGARAEAGGAFVVQKHDARRLHYDLRLEIDGVLKSWAVTRGPSLVPGEKRL